VSGAHQGHVHGAASGGAGREKRLLIAIGLNVGIVVAQVVAGVVAGSVGLLADAAHNLTDVMAIFVSLVAVWLAKRPLTDRRSFGWHRATVIAALFNAASIIAVCSFVVVEAVRRLGDPQPIDGGIVIVAATAGAIFNGLAAFVVADGSGDLNMRGALLHLIADAATSVAVAISALVIILVDGWYWLDPALALLISALIAWQGWRLARVALDVLLEATPRHLDPAAVTSAIEAVDGVDEVHDLHAWSLSSDVVAMSAHLVLTGHPTLEQAQVIAGRAKARLAHDFNIAHATLELECEPCAPDPRCEAEPVSSRHGE
jgi:cobalt-zinc-cadmium efflux system protein